MATRSIVPRADGEGSLGTEAKKWGDVYAGTVHAATVDADALAGKAKDAVDKGLSDAMTAHDASTTAHANLLSSIFRQPSTAYSVGDVAYVKGAGAKYRLACVTAGTTGADELASSLTAGLYITDGAVTWIIEDATQADAVGDITLHPTLLAGHILANGATVKASEYPRLVQWVIDNSMTGTDDAHYTYDESADTLKLPNAQGRVLQGGAAVAVMAAGLPNITGTQTPAISDPYGALPFKCVGDSVNATGAFYADLNTDNTYYTNWHNITGVGNYATSYKTYYRDNFDASKSNPIYGASNTVQPPAITMLAQIKY